MYSGRERHLCAESSHILDIPEINGKPGKDTGGERWVRFKPVLRRVLVSFLRYSHCYSFFLTQNRLKTSHFSQKNGPYSPKRCKKQWYIHPYHAQQWYMPSLPYPGYTLPTHCTGRLPASVTLLGYPHQ